MKKKILAVLLSAAMVAAMAMGCSSGQHHKLKKKMERNLFAGSFHCVKI